MTDHVTVTPAPGVVFLRVTSPAVELTPGEALRLSMELRDCAGVALGVRDGAALRLMLGGTRDA